MKTKIFLSLILTGLIIFSACSAREKTIGLIEKIRHDDFFYSVQNVQKAGTIAGRDAEGTFYVVEFRTQNDAKRVDHEWKNNVAYITDENGNVYENNNELQKLLNSEQPFGYKDTYVTKAGVVESTILVFDIPKDVKLPYLKVRGNMLIGDVLDGNQFKNTKVKLF